MENKHKGSTLESFLEEEGILEAIKNVMAARELIKNLNSKHNVVDKICTHKTEDKISYYREKLKEREEFIFMLGKVVRYLVLTHCEDGVVTVTEKQVEECSKDHGEMSVSKHKSNGAIRVEIKQYDDSEEEDEEDEEECC